MSGTSGDWARQCVNGIDTTADIKGRSTHTTSRAANAP